MRTTLGLELGDAAVELSRSAGTDGGEEGSGTTALMVGVTDGRTITSSDGRGDEGPGASSCLLRGETGSGIDDLLDRGSSDVSQSSGGERPASTVDDNSHASPMDRGVALSSATCSVAEDAVAVRGRKPCETKEASWLSVSSSSSELWPLPGLGSRTCSGLVG